ncbi:MAG TPA: MFS transporter [Pirellulales bacterium]|jgi:EmrB/QacA subfamily drug resistance transporter|nr:MFS transporter [Pirellulales bacterium]
MHAHSDAQRANRPRDAASSVDETSPGYKWIALSNTTLGVFMAFANTSIVLIAMPAIFQGIGVNPLAPAETNYFLWLFLGYLVVTASLLVTCGRISDLFGRVKLYNLGFLVFTVGSVLLAVTPGTGNTSALQLILYRLVQGLGAAFLFANSAAILTDAFPSHERGMAMGFNQVASIVGSLAGLILGGLLATIHWRLVFLISVPFGLFGTFWAYWKLRETARPAEHPHIDWLGNLLFATGLTIFLLAVTYGIQPYGGSPMGWTNPLVIGGIVVGLVLIAVFVVFERRTANPMFRLELFRIRMFAAGNISNFLASLARGGLQFMLIIWLQGIWLPLHGYRFAETPLWAAIYMIPLLVGFGVSGPVCGWLSDRIGSRLLTSVGMLVNVGGFIGLAMLPADFAYVPFACWLTVLGIGQGMFAAPNTAAIMNSLPAEHRGAGSGMRSTFQNAATLLSIGLFFSIVIAALAAHLPNALTEPLTKAGLPANTAAQVAHLPPTSALFAAFLGYNPMRTLVPGNVLQSLPAASRSQLLGGSFFPQLIAAPFMIGLRWAFSVSAAMCAIASIASFLRGRSPSAIAAGTRSVPTT